MQARFRRNKAAVAGLILLDLCLAFALFGPAIAPFSYDYIDFAIMGHAGQLGRPSATCWFGADDQGRDLFSRTAVSVVVGTFYGAVSGYPGGRIDGLMMRPCDIMLSIPFMFVLILMLGMCGKSLSVLYLSIGLHSWPDMAGTVRGQTLTRKAREDIEAAEATGVPTPSIILRHILPNLLGIVVIYATLLVPEVIITESFISFLGLGVQQPQTSLGTLISDVARAIYYDTLWQSGFPRAFFLMLMFGFFFVGDRLRDALDPKER